MSKSGFEDDTEYHSSESGASKTIPAQCSSLRKNGCVMIKGRPCKIVDMSTSKTGKHGHAKVHIVGLDLFTGKKYEDVCPSTHNMDVPVVQRKRYQLIDKNEEYLTLMDEKGEICENVRNPIDAQMLKEIETRIECGVCSNVTVLSAMDEEAVASIDNAPNN